jgi:hypothetical protein
MTATPAEMRAEADTIDAGTHPFFGANTPAITRRLAAKSLRDRADAVEGNRKALRSISSTVRLPRI